MDRNLNLTLGPVSGKERIYWFPAAGSDHPVGQEVLQRGGNGQSLHLLGGQHPPQSHPAHVLQAGNAPRTLPEVHVPVTSSEKKTKKNQEDMFKPGGKK